MKCHKCNKEVKIKTAQVEQHLGIYCAECKGWIKWASPEEKKKIALAMAEATHSKEFPTNRSVLNSWDNQKLASFVAYTAMRYKDLKEDELQKVVAEWLSKAPAKKVPTL